MAFRAIYAYFFRHSGAWIERGRGGGGGGGDIGVEAMLIGVISRIFNTNEFDYCTI
jgi:hypothetical protein